MMNKQGSPLPKIIACVIIVAVVVAAIVLLTKKEPMQSAIDAFENGDYDGAIEELNEIIPAADYEAGEKMYYYRARALNALALELEQDYDDELADASAGKENTPEYKKAEKKIKAKLAKLNENLKSDLELTIGNPSRIASGGRFMDEFVAKYRGSSLIEDLDFEQLKRSVQTSEADKPLRAVLRFYEKYPNTAYLASLVNMIFAQLQTGETAGVDMADTATNILAAYGRRYPTGPELNLIYRCTGDGVNLRDSPSTGGGRVGSIPKDAILLQLEKSMDTAQVGDDRNYWYRVADLDGKRGWIFGKFLKPFDPSSIAVTETEEKWTLSEDFANWTDSNTPENWLQLDDAGKSGIGFRNSGGAKLIVLNSAVGLHTGLFSRYNASKAFSAAARARYIGGDGFMLIVYSLGNEIFYLRIQNETVDVCGRTIPLHTGDMHDYRLTSDDGRFASLSVDGEVLSAKIPPVKSAAAGGNYIGRGLYILCSQADEESRGEAEYVKVR